MRFFLISTKGLWAAVLTVATIAACGCKNAGAAEQTKATFRKWDSVQLRNEYVRLNIMPLLGGRILNYELGSHPFLWSNPALEGRLPPPGGLDSDGSWLNWGGDKLWPAPQGWDNAEEWPGPPDGVLDGGPQALETLPARAHIAGVRLTSPADSRSGIQFQRTIEIFDGSSRVRVHASMTNVVARPVRWGIWTNTQLDAGNRDGKGWNPKLYTYAPLSQQSRTPPGYRILFGPADNQQIEKGPMPGLLKLHFAWKMGKVGMNSDGGWLANVDGTTGYVFIQMFDYHPGQAYPDDSSIAVWTNGLGTLHAFGRTEPMPSDPAKNPYIVESELISPYANLAPGEHSDFDYDWYSANLGGDFPVLGCTRSGCVAEPLRVQRKGRYLRLRGRFGVFYGGHAAIEFSNASGETVGRTKQIDQVSPLKPLVLNDVVVTAPSRAAILHLVVFSQTGKRVGEIAQVAVSAR